MFKLFRKIFDRGRADGDAPIETNTPLEEILDELLPLDETERARKKRVLREFMRIVARRFPEAPSRCLVTDVETLAHEHVDPYSTLFSQDVDRSCPVDFIWHLSSDYYGVDDLEWQASQILPYFGVSEPWKSDTQGEERNAWNAMHELSLWLAQRGLSLLYIECDDVTAVILESSSMDAARSLAKQVQLVVYDHADYRAQHAE